MANENIEPILWNQVLGNPFNQSLDPRMLRDEGLIVEKLGRKVGMSKFESPVPLKIHYDRSYVERWLYLYVMRKLKPVAYNDLQSIVASSFKIWKEQR